MNKPDADAVRAYAPEETTSYDDDQVVGALAAESAAQAARCRVPEPGQDWPADLAEALMRRVLHNLALRGLALGLSVSITENGTSQQRVGGLDAETRRLEAPHRLVVMG